jgi:hypothetical protein
MRTAETNRGTGHAVHVGSSREGKVGFPGQLELSILIKSTRTLSSLQRSGQYCLAGYLSVELDSASS